MTNIILTPLDRKSPVPLYNQLLTDLRARISSGDFTKGSLLPSEGEMARALGVSRITVKRAVDELARDGFVDRQRGRGTTVTANSNIEVDGGLRTLSRAVTNMRKISKLRAFSREVITSTPPEIKAVLNLQDGEAAEHIRYVLRLAGKGYSRANIYVREDISRAITDKDIKQNSLFNILLARNLRIRRADQSITAVSAKADAAKDLGVPVGSPLLQITLLLHGEDIGPIARIISLMNPANYEYEMSLSYGA